MKMLLRIIIFCVCYCCAVALPALRTTTAGVVEGRVSADGTFAVFNSIPFASPPIGDLRFRTPQPHQHWDGVRNVTSEPAPCPQHKTDDGLYTGNEDCLYLHVWQPLQNGSEPRPVMLWIYGGAYVIGSSDKVEYDGAKLAVDKNVVVVTTNYRLGAFGFAALYSLQLEDPQHSTGNMALRDQTAALEWVRDNIANFGGDPGRINLFGESAGGFSVAWHLVSRSSAGLFHSAAMESGSTDTTQFFTPVKDAVSFTELYAQSCGCDMKSVPILGSEDPLLRCLRRLPTHTLMKSLLSVFNPNWPLPANANGSKTAGYRPALAPLASWGPAIDGADAGLRGLPLSLIQKGEFNRVPLVLGTNADEGTLFAPAMIFVVPNITLPVDDDDIVRILMHCLQAYNTTELAVLAPNILANYTDFADPYQKTVALITDFFFACSARRTARAFDAFGVTTWLYQFSYNMSSNWEMYRNFGDYHGAEIPFVFRNLWPPGRIFNANDWAVSDALSAYWTNLATMHDPNDGPGLPLTWPRYSTAADISIQLALPFATTTGLKAGHCDMWDTVLGDLNEHGGVIH